MVQMYNFNKILANGESKMGITILLTAIVPLFYRFYSTEHFNHVLEQGNVATGFGAVSNGTKIL